MPRPGAVPVMLAAAERKTLKKRVRGAKTPYRDRLRAQIVLAAACGRDNTRIARDLGVAVDTVRKWRGRFAARRVDGLADLPRPGRPRQISAVLRAAVVALACQLPAATGVPLSRWTGPELAAEIGKAGLASPISVSSILRILAEHPIKPWQYQSWIYPRDPDFAAKATVILDPLPGVLPGETAAARRPDPVRGRQAVHPGPQPLPPNQPARTGPPGARRARIPAQRRPRPAGRTRRAHREGLRRHPRNHRHQAIHDADGPGHDPAALQGRTQGVRHRRQWLGHRGQAAAGRLRKAHPNAIMIHTPVHASWLNQAEIFFSIIQRKAVTPNDFASLDELSHTLLAFVNRYNATARPFNWKFTAADLADLLDRISAREQPAQLPEAA
jgi:transposase